MSRNVKIDFINLNHFFKQDKTFKTRAIKRHTTMKQKTETASNSCFPYYLKVWIFLYSIFQCNLSKDTNLNLNKYNLILSIQISMQKSG